MSADSPNSYDRMPYRSSPVAATHPAAMAALAALFGLEPPPVDGCRVLELGCADGGNIISLALALPESEFVGVDLSSRQIADARRTAEAVGVSNLDLREMSLTDVDASFGEFDYVVCHGVYSWVPDAVRERILGICAERLTPRGLAFISYNAQPGWHLRGMLREMMFDRDRPDADPAERTAEAQALVEFLAEHATEKGAYRNYLRGEAVMLAARDDFYVFHDLLEEENHAFTVREFARQSAAHGLEFLSDPELDPLLGSDLSAAAQARIRETSRDHIDREQLADFLSCRFFRRSMVCRAGRSPDRERFAARLPGLHVASFARPSGPDADPRSTAPLELQWPDGSNISTNDPHMKAAFLQLGRAWPRATSFAALWDGVVRAVGPAAADFERDKRQRLADVLLRCYAAGKVELTASPPRCAAEVGERPAASPLARLQAERGIHRVTNLRHGSVELDETARQLLGRLDGTRDLPAISREWPSIAPPAGPRPSLEDYLRHLVARSLLLP